MDSGGFCIRYGEMPGPRGVYKICLQSEKKNAITLHFTLMASCHVFHVCTDPLTPGNGKCSLLATKGQTLGNEHFFFFFAFLPPKNINRQQWERKD